MTQITVNGTTYDSDGAEFAGYAYVTGIIAMLADALADLGRAMATTSASSYALGSGTGTITMAEAVPFTPGAFFVLADQAAPTTNYAFCQVTSRSGASLTFTEVSVVGSGTKTAWNINVAGARGAPGALSGNASGAIDMNGFAITLHGVTLSAAVAGADQEVARVKLKDYAETLVTANTGTTYTVDLEDGNVLDLTLTGNCTFTFSNPPASGIAGAFTMILTQDGTGSRSVTWPASVEWAGGSAPTITATAGGTDVFTFITVDGGTTWRGFTAGQDFS